MRVNVQGQGYVTLNQNHFVGGGGQGSVYAVGDTAYKIANLPSGALPEGKIRELQVLPIPLFARPENIILDANGKAIGYTSRYIRDAYVLCQLFTRTFRDRAGFTHAHAFKLVEKMRDGFVAAHRAGVLLVDPNEMNFLVSRDFESLFFIDTDGYQTKSYPATAIMESIRDRHMAHRNAFNEGTDWFSFAVTSFQLLTGIHPYKGKHPTLKGFDERMKANVSVFNKAVSMPATAYPMSVIPSDWRNWFEAVFERGERTPPPSGATVQVHVTPHLSKSGTTVLVAEEIARVGHNVHDLWVVGGHIVASTADGVWVDGRRVSDTTVVAGVIHSTNAPPILACPVSGGIDLLDTGTKARLTTLGLNAQQIMSYAGTAYAKVHDTVVEIVVHRAGTNAVAATRKASSVLPNATHMFQGGVLQNMLGSMFASLFPESGRTYQVRLPELDQYRILDAHYSAGIRGGVLMVLGKARNGCTDRLVFRFGEDFTKHDCRVVYDVDNGGLNFAVTDAGVCVCVVDGVDGPEIELTSVTLGSTTAKTVCDPWLTDGVRLFKRGSEILAVKGDGVYTVRMS